MNPNLWEGDRMATVRTQPAAFINNQKKSKHFRKTTLPQLVSHLFLCLGAYAMVFPLFWLISSAFKSSKEIFSKNFTFIPKTITLQNFIDGWSVNPQYPFGHFLLNTFQLVLCVIVGTVFSCSLTAFAFARLNFKFKRIFFMIMLSTLMLPHQVTLIPRYLIFRNLQWLNSYLPFIVPAFMALGGFHIFLLVQFIRGIPIELDESARIDGCSTIRIYWNIIMPLSLPVIFSVAIFTFLWTWDDFLNQLIYLSEVKIYTVPLILRSLVDTTSSTSWGPLMALTLLSLIPSVVLFFVAQPYFVEGIATTGIKG